MVNKVSKGTRYELEAKKLLIEQGYLVERKNMSRWQSNDFWTLFDLLCIHPDTAEVRLIQIKTNVSHFYKARKDIVKWIKSNKLNPAISCEVWLREPKKKWRKETLCL